MAYLPYAFSVHHFISTVGADAGFASIVGLAILVLLFFAQARETTTLRDQLAEAGERVQSLEARLSQALRAAPAPAAAAQPGVPAASARAAAPAAASASPAGAAPAPVGTPAGASQAASGVPAAGGPPPGVAAPAQGAATRLIPDLTTVQPPVTAAATAAGAAGAGTRTPAPAPAPAPVAANGNPTSPPAEPPPRLQIRPAAATSSAARRPSAGSPLASTGRVGPAPRARRVLAAVLALAAIAAAVIVLLVLTSGGGSSGTSTTTTQASNAPAARPRHHRAASSSVVPSSVTVAVLNGTATNGLAHRVAVKLIAGGFRQGNITTAVDQTRTATTVAYLPGQRKAALAVAGTLNLGSASVAPADQTTRTVACQGLSPAACSAQAVIVTVGSDLANIR